MRYNIDLRTRLPALLLSLLAVFTASTVHAHSEPWIPGTPVGAFTGVTPQNRIKGHQLASWLSEANLEFQLGGWTSANGLSITALASGSGLFQQRDPMGFADSVNLYAGFAWDPINNRDHTGMEACGWFDSDEECLEKTRAGRDENDDYTRKHGRSRHRDLDKFYTLGLAEGVVAPVAVAVAGVPASGSVLLEGAVGGGLYALQDQAFGDAFHGEVSSAETYAQSTATGAAVGLGFGIVGKGLGWILGKAAQTRAGQWLLTRGNTGALQRTVAEFEAAPGAINLTRQGDGFGRNAAGAPAIEGYTDVAIHGAKHSVSPTPGGSGPRYSPTAFARILREKSSYEGGAGSAHCVRNRCV